MEKLYKYQRLLKQNFSINISRPKSRISYSKCCSVYFINPAFPFQVDLYILLFFAKNEGHCFYPNKLHIHRLFHIL